MKKRRQQLLSGAKSQHCLYQAYFRYIDKQLSTKQQGITDSSNTYMDHMSDKYFMWQR
jgi:hypothetical protein